MQEVFAVIPRAKELILYSDGGSIAFQAGSSEYKQIMDAWSRMTEHARQMPAFGVSIDELTRKEMGTGIWLEFIFPEELQSNDLSFDSLLIEVRGEYSGFNMIRNRQGLYQGRCIYVDLNGKTMADLKECLAAMGR